MADPEIEFTGWSHGPTTVPQAIFEVGDQSRRAFVVTFEVPEPVLSRLAAAEQAEDEPDADFVERIQGAVRAHGDEYVRRILADPDRRRAAEQEGHVVHEVAGHEVHRLTAHLPSRDER